MKRLLLVSLLLSLMIVGMPLVTATSVTENVSPSETPKKAEKLAADAERSVTVLVSDTPAEMTVFDYLVGVVAGEMPVSFEIEALKAQAVAARSYLQRALDQPKHDNADICSSSDCCQAYLSCEDLKKAWGDKYDGYIERIREAVAETDGKYLSYEGEAALAAFHSSSDGSTEDSGALWSSLPYLVSVSTPETAENVPNFVSTLKLTDIDFRDTVLYLKPGADMTGEPGTWVGEIKRDKAGRVESAVIGGVTFTGQELRSLFSLRSADFELTHEADGFVFTVHGYGHGIGMSQYGANVMAKSGSDYKDILAHYYPGTTLT